jgi:hypothetical protein
MAIGATKDKRVSEKMMIIKKIETVKVNWFSQVDKLNN